MLLKLLPVAPPPMKQNGRARVCECKSRMRFDFAQLDEFRVEIQRRDQEILAMSAKMKTLEEQHQDYQRHIAVLKESLCAKEEHYNMLQGDVEEMRQRLEEKNRQFEKKTGQHQQERQRAGAEVAEMREHMDIKDRKINVLQRKVIVCVDVQCVTEHITGVFRYRGL